jgi:hypothetical protein
MSAAGYSGSNANHQTYSLPWHRLMLLMRAQSSARSSGLTLAYGVRIWR